MASDNYPVRTVDEVEELADELGRAYLAYIGHGSLTTPVPVEDMAEHYLGYSIDITDEGLFSDPNFLGGIDFQHNKIYVNASVVDHDGRYAFTVAHEIGHHVLHREAYLSIRSTNDQEILCREAATKPLIEVEADRFAAALLMPSDIVEMTVSQIEVKRTINSAGQARGFADKVIRSGGFKNVSNTAMLNRLIDLEFAPKEIQYQNSTYQYKRRPFSLFRAIKNNAHRVLGKPYRS